MFDYVWLCMTLYDFVFMTKFDYVWLCMPMYDYILLCMAMYGYIWLCLTMYDYVWLCVTMYDYVCLCMTLSDFVWLCMTMYGYVWQCMTMYDYLWLYMTIYDYVWLSMRETMRAILKTFSYFFRLFETIKIFQTIEIFFSWFKCFQTFHTLQQTLTLFTFVYLCSTDASMHKFCACFDNIYFWKGMGIIGLNLPKNNTSGLRNSLELWIVQKGVWKIQNKLVLSSAKLNASYKANF